MNTEIWAWLAALIVFAAAEGATSQLVSLWFMGGALAAMIAAICGAALWLQITLFFAVSVILLLLLRPMLKKYLNPHLVPTNADRNIGMTAVVVEAIDNLHATGRVKVDGKDWAARSEDGKPIAQGEKVVVRRIEGVRLYVERQTVASGKK